MFSCLPSEEARRASGASTNSSWLSVNSTSGRREGSDWRHYGSVWNGCYFALSFINFDVYHFHFGMATSKTEENLLHQARNIFRESKALLRFHCRNLDLNFMPRFPGLKSKWVRSIKVNMETQFYDLVTSKTLKAKTRNCCCSISPYVAVNLPDSALK